MTRLGKKIFRFHIFIWIEINLVTFFLFQVSFQYNKVSLGDGVHFSSTKWLIKVLGEQNFSKTTDTEKNTTCEMRRN